MIQWRCDCHTSLWLQDFMFAFWSVYILAHYTLVQILTREESTLWGVCSMCLIVNMLVLDRQVLSFEIASFTCQTVNLDCVSLWDGYDLGLNRLNRLGSLEVLLLWWLVLVGLLGDKQRQVWECDGEGETRALECLNIMIYVYLCVYLLGMKWLREFGVLQVKYVNRCIYEG